MAQRPLWGQHHPRQEAPTWTGEGLTLGKGWVGVRSRARQALPRCHSAFSHEPPGQQRCGEATSGFLSRLFAARLLLLGLWVCKGLNPLARKETWLRVPSGCPMADPSANILASCLREGEVPGPWWARVGRWGPSLGPPCARASALRWSEGPQPRRPLALPLRAPHALVAYSSSSTFPGAEAL